MYMKFPFTFIISFLAFILLFLFVSCLKQSAYAQIINETDTDSLISIKDLRKIHTIGNVEFINKTMAIEATIVANDEHDNLYKSISIQDSTAGIIISLEGVSLYQVYPIGTTIRLHLKNLFLTDYRRMLQVVASVDTSSGQLLTSGIPATLFSKHISIIKDKDRKSTRLNSSHIPLSRMPSSA